MRLDGELGGGKLGHGVFMTQVTGSEVVCAVHPTHGLAG